MLGTASFIVTALPAEASTALVSGSTSATQVGTTGAITVTSPQNVSSASNVLLLQVQVFGPNSTGVGTISDTKTGTWTALGQTTVSGDTQFTLWQCTNPQAGVEHAVTWTPSAADSWGSLIVMSEWAGGPFTIDKMASVLTSSGTSEATPSVTPSTAGELIPGVADETGGSPWTSPTNSFTAMTTPNNANVMAYLVDSATSAISTAWSVSPADAGATAIFTLSSSGSFTVTFNGNGSTGGSMSPESSSTPAALTTNTYTLTGSTFTGWNTATNDTGTAYANGATYPFTGSTTLYAQWTDLTEAGTFPVNTKVLGGTTLSVNPQKVGDLLIFSSQIWSQTITVTGVTCPEAGAWQLAKRYVDTVNGVITEEIWWAVVTSTGPTTITAAYSGSVAALSPELVSDSFTSANPSSWSFVSGSGAATTNTTAITFPSVTSGGNAVQLYWGYVESTAIVSPGSTSGFAYATTSAANLTTSNDGLNPSTGYAPTASETAGSNNTSIAAIFAVGPATQTISYTSTAPTNATVGGGTYTPTATGGASGNPVVITLDSTSTGCTLTAGVVSFTSVGVCVIDANQAGNSNYAVALQVQQLISDRNSGGGWVQTGSQNTTATQNNYLQGVSCVSVSDCWAVGYYYTGSYRQTLIEQYNGTSWSIVSSPNTSATQNNYLEGVTCVSATDCWAVGYYLNSYNQTLIEQWNGTSWSIVSSPNASTLYNYLYSVTCVSATDCWAVGPYYTGAFQTLIEQYNGTSWSIVSSPNTSPSYNNYLYSVTCVNASACWATGYYVNASPNYLQTLIEKWNGASWSIVSSPNTSMTQNNVLEGVTCVSASDCWAVGYYLNSYNQTLIEQWNGTSWSIVSSANPSTFDYLFAITCVSATDCWAVGDSGLGGPQLIEQWNGTSWSTDLSTGGGTNDGVSCVSASDCWAVGYYMPGSYYQTFIEQLLPLPQTITITSTVPSSATVGGAPYTATATSTSGLAVTISLDGTSTACSLTSGTSPVVVSFTAVGTCVIDANQAGNGNYLGAPQAQQSFSVAIGSQTINFNSPSGPASPTVGGATYPATPPIPAIATATSGLTVSISSTTTSVCTVATNTVTFVGAGTCTLDANQSGNTNFTAATQVTQSFTVSNARYTSISCPIGSSFCVAVTNTGKEVIWSANLQNVPSYLTK